MFFSTSPYEVKICFVLAFISFNISFGEGIGYSGLNISKAHLVSFVILYQTFLLYSTC